MRLVDDLADVVDNTRSNMRPGQMLILLGHSMGGVVVASFVRQQMRPVDGIILSSPAFDPGLNAVQKFLLSVLPRISPNLRVDNGLKIDKLSRDPLVVLAYRSDAFVHRKISGRMAKFISDEGALYCSCTPLDDANALDLRWSRCLGEPRGKPRFSCCRPQTVGSITLL
jgi:alpha-beta hydrolase superfamily lysophospholipase